MSEVVTAPADTETDTAAAPAAETSDEGLQKQRQPAPVSDPRALRLFFDPPGTLRLTVADAYSYATVRLYQAAPLSLPGLYLSLLDGKGEEITMVPSIDDLTPEARPAAEEEIRRRYLTATVRALTDVRTEFGVTYWHAVTDRGERDFVVQSLSESCIWLSDRHILLIDVDGNRFEIPDRYALDAASQQRLEGVL